MTKKFREAELEQAIIELVAQQGIPQLAGDTLVRAPEEVLLPAELRTFLRKHYQTDGLTEAEIDRILRKLQTYPASDLYDSNRAILKKVTNGFIFKRDDRQQKDLYIQLIDFSEADANSYQLVTQLPIEGNHKRIPDAILYINGLPLVVFEFKSAIREEIQLYEAYHQLTVTYRRDIPELFKYNAFCVISDGANTRAGSLFSAYDYYYAWRRIAGDQGPVDGIPALDTLIKGMLQRDRLRDIIQNFVFLPDTSQKELKVLCRYPQYYAARALFDNIKAHQKPKGDGKGGTYFGATGSGKSFTMLFLSRLLMKSPHFRSPTIILITDRTDLDDQLSKQFTNAKTFLGDEQVISVSSRKHLRALLQGRNSGGVFLTTIHKFTEDTELLTERSNVICISDEAHRSQVNLDQKVRVTEERVHKTYGFARYLHDSLPNATYVGFTGTPIDATFDVFGPVVDAYTMTESVQDKITVPIVYEGRAAKVLLNSQKLEEIEAYYKRVAEEGGNEYQIEESKKAMAQMRMILGDPKRVQAVAKDLVAHYEKRLAEGSTVAGKAMIVCSSREIAYALYQCLIELRPAWKEVKAAAEGAILTEEDKRKLKPMPYLQMVMTRNKKDPKELYDLLGTKAQREKLDRQFKRINSNFKVAIVVDMWLTGFDVPFLDTMYIDKPIKRHTLIQTISRVNRTFEGKNKGLVVDYIGIKKQMNLALALFNKTDRDNFEDIRASIIIMRDHLDLLAQLFHGFDSSGYFEGRPVEQLHTLNMAVEFVQQMQKREQRYMALVKRLKAAYDLCAGSDELEQQERDQVHFYLAVRSIIIKMTRGTAPDITQMNDRVRRMIEAALQSNGVEEIYKMGDEQQSQINLFDPDYLARIRKIKLPHTKIKLLQKVLAKAISDFRRTNRMKGIDFSQKFQALVARYNERRDQDILQSDVLEEFTDELFRLIERLHEEVHSFEDMGIDFEEKAFYDILKAIRDKYEFEYPEEKLIMLARKVKDLVDDKARYPDWSQRADIKAELRAFLIILLDENDYPPITHDEVYAEVMEQAEGFKKGLA